MKNTNISKKNIRATVLSEFWGDEFEESIYLWEGAKYNLNLKEIENSEVPTVIDLYKSTEEITTAHEFCMSVYYKFLPVLAGKLNELHKVKLSVSFWQISFGYWLYRHIAISYDKFSYLEKLDINSTSIKLLHKNDFFVPSNHYEYIFCFASDFGVQQLVSQYYYLYADKHFPVVNKTYKTIEENPASLPNTKSFDIKKVLFVIKKVISKVIDGKNITRKEFKKKSGNKKYIQPQIVLLAVYFSNLVNKQLKEKSDGQINSISLPAIEELSAEPDVKFRQKLLNIKTESKFEHFFINTLPYCIPKDLIEYFNVYRTTSVRDIRKKSFKYIVSEGWISNIPVAIYVATAKEDKRSFIINEHGSGVFFYNNYFKQVDFDVADKYITVGWKSNRVNLVQGGFAGKDIFEYKFDPVKDKILFVTRTKFNYWIEYNEYNAVNSNFTKELKIVYDFIYMIPAVVQDKFVLRLRREEGLCDTGKILDIKKMSISIDEGEFSSSIHKYRIIVIDHISTGIAELLMIKVPFLLLHDVDFISCPTELVHIFRELKECGVIHVSAQSAQKYLSIIYDDVQGWWESKNVQDAVNKLVAISLAPASKTSDYLLSLLS